MSSGGKRGKKDEAESEAGTMGEEEDGMKMSNGDGEVVSGVLGVVQVVKDTVKHVGKERSWPPQASAEDLFLYFGEQSLKAMREMIAEVFKSAALVMPAELEDEGTWIAFLGFLLNMCKGKDPSDLSRRTLLQAMRGAGSLPRGGDSLLSQEQFEPLLIALGSAADEGIPAIEDDGMMPTERFAKVLDDHSEEMIKVIKSEIEPLLTWDESDLVWVSTFLDILDNRFVRSSWNHSPMWRSVKHAVISSVIVSTICSLTELNAPGSISELTRLLRADETNFMSQIANLCEGLVLRAARLKGLETHEGISVLNASLSDPVLPLQGIVTTGSQKHEQQQPPGPLSTTEVADLRDKVPKRQKNRLSFFSDQGGKRLRLSANEHVPIRLGYGEKTVTGDAPPARKYSRQKKCVLCDQRATTICSICGVGLHVVVRPGMPNSCWALFHTSKNLNQYASSGDHAHSAVAHTHIPVTVPAPPPPPSSTTPL